MSSTLRTVARHARFINQRAGPSTHTRAIHSAFTAQSSRTRASPLNNTPSSTPREIVYEHESTTTTEVHTEPATTGSRTYVVSEPHPADKRYGVPSGAYPTSAPYQNFPSTSAPEEVTHSSTSSSPAHPATTSAGAIPHNESGVGESSAVRHGSAPGEMGKRGGGRGGLRMMDTAGTKGENNLGERNPPPAFGEQTEKFAKAGVDEAWKLRK